MDNTSIQPAPPYPKLFIQMSGAPGSGKSTLSKHLQSHINATILDHDIIRSTVLSHNPEFSVAAKLAYDLTWALAEDILTQNLSVIIDSPCNYQEAVDSGMGLAKRYGAQYWYVECRVDDMGLLDERLRQRVPLRSQRTGVNRPPIDVIGTGTSEDSRQIFEKWIKEPCRPDPDKVIVIGSAKDPEECGDEVLRRMFDFDGAQPLEANRESAEEDHDEETSEDYDQDGLLLCYLELSSRYPSLNKESPDDVQLVKACCEDLRPAIETVLVGRQLVRFREMCEDLAG